ncbi:MAG: restriction endonuclease subunit S [Phycisphaerales bacterium]|nr:restriction endonuclease subunit S [Phycisphaerales bacterium]
MKRWPTKPLGEVLEISRERIEPAKYPDTLFNYIGLEAIEGHTGNLLPYQPTLGAEIKSTKNMYHHGEILYGKLRPYLNKVHLAVDEGICSTDIYVLRPRERCIHPSFAANYLRSSSTLSAVTGAMAGANLPRIGHESLLGILIPLPPLAEQERIVKLLDEADELRKLRAQADRRTADLIPALFHEMFGDPVTNPKGWPESSLGHVLSISRERIDPANCGGTFFNYVGLESLEGHTGNLLPYKPKLGPEIKSAKNVFNPGEILFGRLRPYLNKVHLAEAKGICSTDIYVLRPNSERLHPSFTANCLRSPYVLSTVSSAMVGANLPRVSPGALLGIKIPIPPVELQGEFAEIASEIRQLEAIQTNSRARLEAIFQSVLHRAFNGEI